MSSTSPPSFWGVVVGISDYVGTNIDLHFAAMDAEAFGKALELGANRLFTPAGKVTITNLTTDRPYLAPTKQNILNAIRAARASLPSE